MKKKIIIIAIIVIILILTLLLFRFFSFKYNEGRKPFSVLTDKSTYANKDNLVLKVENGLDSSACFSSCYPYYFETRDGDQWKKYEYTECESENKNSFCIEPSSVKAFKITLPDLILGQYRILLPICLGCIENSQFNQSQAYYSNSFKIK